MKRIIYKNMRLLVWVISIPALLTSCTHYHYATNTNNVPLLKEARQGKINMAYFAADEVDGFEFKSSYATGKHVGVMANITAGGGKEGDSHIEDDRGSGYYMEGGIGWFTPIQNSGLIFETYAGVGTGSIKNHYAPSEHTQTSFTKYFLQPAFGYSTKGFEVAFSSKISAVHLRVNPGTVISIGANPQDYMDIQYLKAHPTSIIWEPGLTLRGGFKNMLVSLDLTVSQNLSHSWKQEPSGFAFGICLPFNMPKNNSK